MDPYGQQNQNPQPGVTPNPSYNPPTSPQPPSTYTAPVPNYDPNYLDTIAAAPPRAKFLSGTFGKVFYILIGVFVLAVSLIIAFSGKDNTTDLQQISVRLQNFAQVSKTVHKSIKSQNLAGINSELQIWLTGNQNVAEDLLGKGGVKKTEYNKEMVRKEKAIAAALDTKFEDARLSATLNRVYASTMTSETEKLINMLDIMAKKSKSKQIREFASDASKNLAPIHQEFEDFNDNGN